MQRSYHLGAADGFRPLRRRTCRPRAAALAVPAAAPLPPISAAAVGGWAGSSRARQGWAGPGPAGSAALQEHVRPPLQHLPAPTRAAALGPIRLLLAVLHSSIRLLAIRRSCCTAVRRVRLPVGGAPRVAAAAGRRSGLCPAVPAEKREQAVRQGNSTPASPAIACMTAPSSVVAGVHPAALSPLSSNTGSGRAAPGSSAPAASLSPPAGSPPPASALGAASAAAGLPPACGSTAAAALPAGCTLGCSAGTSGVGTSATAAPASVSGEAGAPGAAASCPALAAGGCSASAGS